MKGIFQRTELLFGQEKMKHLAETKVIIFGIGGVGSWCAESLVRTGISKLTIVDSDIVCVTNINRQLQATCKTIGQVKTEVLKQRLLEINPKAEITAVQKIYSKENYQEFELENYGFIIDCIDSISNKIHLMHTAVKTNAKFFSSMGAALKIDSTKIKVGWFSEVKGCRLARHLRKLMRKQHYPEIDFQCVYSDEMLPNLNIETECLTANCLSPKSESYKSDNELENYESINTKAIINGSFAHITGIFGFSLAGLVLKEIYYEQ